MTSRTAELFMELQGDGTAADWKESSFAAKDLGVLVDKEFECESAFVATKAVCTLSYITTGCVQFCGPSTRKILSSWSKSS